MKPLSALAIFGAVAAVQAGATIHRVKAVAQPSFRFEPNIITAEVGDYIEFHFGPKNHSVARGSFSKACAPTHDGGFFSGYLPVEEGESDKVFKVLVEDSEPIVFYCTQGQHCTSGMFGIVNPTRKLSGNAYAALAAGLEDKKAAEPNRGPFGGALVDNPDAELGGSGTVPATGAFTTNIGRPTDVDSIPGSIETEAEDEEDGGAMVGAPVVGLVAAFGFALLLA